MMILRSGWIWLLVSGLAAGCSDGGSAGDGGVDAADATGGDPGADDGGPGPDDGGPDGGDPAQPSPECQALGLPTRAFIQAPDNETLYALAADVEIPTLDGPWRLGEQWTGCDLYLFVPDSPRQANGWPIDLWERDLDGLLAASPRNVHFFFVSVKGDETERHQALADLKTLADGVLNGLPVEDAEWWRGRIHYVTERDVLLPGWLGDVMQHVGRGVGIDRLQRIRHLGSLADYARYDPARQWFAPNLALVTNEAKQYNFEAGREEALAAVPATLVPVFSGEVLSDPDWAGVRGTADVNLPDAASMSTFDTLELDLHLGCGGEKEYGECPAWDYLVHLYLCEVDLPDLCEVELGRWVTTYHREGRWVHDVSPMLPLLAGGGVRRFAFYTQQPYTVDLKLRLLDRGASAPAEATPLFTGGTFDANYNTDRPPVVVAVPADATRVELSVVVSGHGMAEPGNCAEFCDTSHHFLVNGVNNPVSFPQAGTDQDCMDQVALGTVPNQYGTWWYGRSGWCPGQEVPMRVLDVTDQVILGQDNTFEYQGLYLGSPYPAGGASIRLSSWVVIYR